jgi:hypothetical protein
VVRGATTARATLVRHDLRRRWRLAVVVGVLLGLAAGAGLAAVAGARRTETSFARHLDATNASHVEIGLGTLNEASDAAVRALPGVESASWWSTEAVFLLEDDGRVRQDAVGLLAITSDGRYLDQDLVSMADGRRVDPSQPDEVMINQPLADRGGFEVGDTLPIGWVPFDPESGLPAEDVDPIDPIEAEIVGIMAPNEDVIGEELDRVAIRMYVSPAYTPPEPGWSPEWYGFAWYGLRLEDGYAGTSRVLEAWEEAADEHNAGSADGPATTQWLTSARRVQELETTAERAVRPVVAVLVATGLLLVLTVVVLATQALTRSARQEVDIQRQLRLLGTDRPLLVASAMAVPSVTAIVAAVVATAVAWLASTRFPVGPFTVLEPSPGRQLDSGVLVPGLFVVVLAPLVAVALTVRQEVRRLLRPVASEERSSRASVWLSRAGAPEPVSAAVRLTAPGRGSGYVPTRSVLASVVVVVSALVAAIVFTENLDGLADHPDRFGWSGDSLVMSDGGYGGFSPTDAAEYVAGRDDVSGWRLLAGDRVTIDGESVAAVAYGPGEGDAAGYQPVVVEGRAPTSPDEVVLGDETLAALGRELGDEVRLGGEEATVVGRAVFPVFGPVLALRTGLDVGAWVLPEAQAMDFVGTEFGPPFNGLLLDLEPGAVVVPGDETGVDIFGVLEPTEVTTVTDAAGYEPAIIGVLGAAGLSAVLLVLIAVVRRRRDDLGIYRVLGFSPRQLRATIAVQGVLFAAAAAVIGLPVGVVVGRLLWRALAHTLGVVDVTTTPWAWVLLAGLGVLAVGALTSIPPALAAGRHRHAVRDERA